MNPKLALSVGAVALTVCQAGQARDLTRLLAGEYMQLGYASCIIAPPGASFNPVTLAAPQGSTVSTFTLQGTRIFNGDGTGQDSGVAASLNLPNASGFTGGAFSTSFSGPFTYTVDDALNITMIQAPFYSTALSGPGIGTATLVSDVPPLKGKISEDLTTITFQHETPGIETISGPGPNNTTITRQRICVRERTATRVKRGHHNED